MRTLLIGSAPEVVRASIFPSRMVAVCSAQAWTIGQRLAAELACEGKQVLYLCGDNRFDPYAVARFAKSQRQSPEEALGRVLVARAFTAYQLNVADTSYMPKLREIAAKLDREISFYDLDIPASQHYLYLRKLFPLCRLEAGVDMRGDVIEISAINSAWDLDHPSPPLRVMRMRGERMRPLKPSSRIIIATDSDEIRIHPIDGAKAINLFNDLIRRCDPDLILSERGDSVLFPTLLKIAKSENLQLSLDRDRVFTQRKIETEGRSYFSYGNIIYKPPSYPIFGRWHIDRENSFAHHEAGMEGLLEQARLSRVPVQRMARLMWNFGEFQVWERLIGRLS